MSTPSPEVFEKLASFYLGRHYDLESGELLDDPSLSLVEEQVRNGIPLRMALLYLLAAEAKAPPGLTTA